jgi:hypothetical protein
MQSSSQWALHRWRSASGSIAIAVLSHHVDGDCGRTGYFHLYSHQGFITDTQMDGVCLWCRTRPRLRNIVALGWLRSAR